MEKRVNKSVVILSGGIDSTVLVYDLVLKGDKVLCISFNYGQRHKKELRYATRTCKKLKLQHKIIDISKISKAIKLNNALTGHILVPEGHYEDKIMRQTVVPFRNGIMLMIAAQIASTLNYDRIAYGAHAGDHTIYPDCRPEFIYAMRRVLKIGDYKEIGLYVPYMSYTKTDIVRRGEGLKVDFRDCWSCYKGQKKACGKCGTCIERIEAFKKAGVVDPIKYEN